MHIFPNLCITSSTGQETGLVSTASREWCEGHPHIISLLVEEVTMSAIERILRVGTFAICAGYLVLKMTGGNMIKWFSLEKRQCPTCKGKTLHDIGQQEGKTYWRCFRCKRVFPKEDTDAGGD